MPFDSRVLEQVVHAAHHSEGWRVEDVFARHDNGLCLRLQSLLRMDRAGRTKVYLRLPADGWVPQMVEDDQGFHLQLRPSSDEPILAEVWLASFSTVDFQAAWSAQLGRLAWQRLQALGLVLGAHYQIPKGHWHTTGGKQETLSCQEPHQTLPRVVHANSSIFKHVILRHHLLSLHPAKRSFSFVQSFPIRSGSAHQLLEAQSVIEAWDPEIFSCLGAGHAL